MSDILDINSQEFEVYQSYRQLYEAQHPQPEMKNEADWTDAGLIFKGKIITTVAAVLLAGFRTAEQFYLAASNGDNLWLGWFEAILAVLAIEGLILFLAADKAKRRGEVHEWVSWIGIFIALGISLVAGLGQSLNVVINLDTQIAEWFTLALAVGLSLASLVAYIGGEIIGQELARIDAANDKNRDEYYKELESWENSLNASWSRSQERKLVRSGLSKPVENFPKVSANYSDWRHVPHEERIKMSQMTAKEIRDTYGVEERTSYNWKEQAEEYAEENFYSDRSA